MPSKEIVWLTGLAPAGYRRLANDEIGGAGVTGFNQQLARRQPWQPPLVHRRTACLPSPGRLKATYTAALYRGGVFVVWGRGRPLSCRTMSMIDFAELVRVFAALGVAIHCLGFRMPGSAPNSGECALRGRILRSA